MPSNKVNYAFFGSSRLSVIVLNELKKSDYLPAIIVTTRDKPQGRKLILTPNVVKQWAIDNNIPYHDPLKLDVNFVETLKINTDTYKVKLFIVASYGKIIPPAVLAIPPKGTLNIHPSLLPKYRGPSPLPSAMIDDQKHTGITIMLMNEQMDHGPIITQKEVDIVEWPVYEQFEEMMAIAGAHILEDTIPKWVNGELKVTEQDHSHATYTKKIKKEDGLIDISNLNDPKTDQYLIFRKIQAYHEWPQAYFLTRRNGHEIRVKITSATFNDGKLTIVKVIPEGSKEMLYEDFLRGLK